MSNITIYLFQAFMKKSAMHLEVDKINVHMYIIQLIDKSKWTNMDINMTQNV